MGTLFSTPYAFFERVLKRADVLYLRAAMAVDGWRAAVQRRLGGSEYRWLEKQLSGAKSSNQFLVSRNRQLQQALGGKPSRAGQDALIVGRSRFGEIIRDTSLTYDEVYLPTLDVEIKVTETGLRFTKGKVPMTAIQVGGSLYLDRVGGVTN